MDNYRRSRTLQRWEAFLRSSSSKVKIKAKVEQETDDRPDRSPVFGPRSPHALNLFPTLNLSLFLRLNHCRL